MSTSDDFDHWLVLSYEKDEYMPILLGLTHNLKCKNIFNCKSKIESNDGYIMVVKKTGIIEGYEVNICIKYNLFDENPAFVSGTLTTNNNKEFPINASWAYQSLQIENWCYDNIQVIRLDKNPFEES
jgi:hypothetical protein